LAFSDDRAAILIAKGILTAQGGRISVIDWANESVKYAIDVPFGVAGLALSPDNKTIAVGGGQRVQLFEPSLGNFFVNSIVLHRVTSARFDPTRRLLTIRIGPNNSTRRLGDRLACITAIN